MAKIIDMLARRPGIKKKYKSRRKRRVFWELVSECQQTGSPDVDLIDKIFEDLIECRFTELDVFAIYLYRKKLER